MSYTLKKQGNLIYKQIENRPLELLAKVENRIALITKKISSSNLVGIENKLVYAQSFDSIQLSLYLSDGNYKYYYIPLSKFKEFLKKEISKFSEFSDYVIPLDKLSIFEKNFFGETKIIDTSKLSEIENKRINLLGIDWWAVLKDDLELPEIRRAAAYLTEERKTKTIYPAVEDTFRAFKLCPFNKVKVVILGQDPYHNGSADGLAFSSRDEKNVPNSLFQMFTAIGDTYQKCLKRNLSPNLECWAEQGVFLLNTSLTVEKGVPNSHKGVGWEVLAGCALKKLSLSDRPIVYLLLGKEANEFKRFLTSPYQLVLNTEHPAASLYQKREWEHRDVFNKANEYLTINSLTPINWDTKVFADYTKDFPF